MLVLAEAQAGVLDVSVSMLNTIYLYICWYERVAWIAFYVARARSASFRIDFDSKATHSHVSYLLTQQQQGDTHFENP
eukprot:6211371-Pleurochrysis_carterae.AAC.2